VVNAVSRSGSNSFHGSAYEFLRNSALDARNFFDGSSKPPFRQNQFGGSLGGPIKKDKLFFFVNNEELKSLGQTVVALVPTPTTMVFSHARWRRVIICDQPTCVGESEGRVHPSALPLPTAGETWCRQHSADSQTGSENYLLTRVDYNHLTKHLCAMRDYGDTIAVSAPASAVPEIGFTRTTHDRRVPP
jgi:hypothetical protein